MRVVSPTAVIALVVFVLFGSQAIAQGRYGDLPSDPYAASSTEGSLSRPATAGDSRYGGSSTSKPNKSTFDLSPIESLQEPKSSPKPKTTASSTNRNTTPPMPKSAVKNPFENLAAANRQGSSSVSPSTSPSRTPQTPQNFQPLTPQRERQPAARTTPQRSTQSRSTYAQSSNNLRANTSSRSSQSQYERNTQPTASSQPTTGSLVSRNPRQASSRERIARDMLIKMLTAPRQSRLTGQPVRLGSILSTAPTRDRQAAIVQEYWALTATIADYYLGLHEAEELNRLRQRLPTYSQALGEAQAAQRARVDTSYRAARAAQMRLGQLMGDTTLPLPADIPFCGPYATRFEQIFRGTGSEEARLLNDLIPLRLGEVQDAVSAVRRSEQWLDKVGADQGPGSTGDGMIRALELLALNRRAFVQLVRDYNLQIHRYTRLATPGEVDTDRLVAMLIRTDSTLASRGSSNLEFRPGGSSRR